MSGPEPVSWTSADIDHDRPSAARLYDYYLGGAYNFTSDRELARRIMAVLPDMPVIARENRRFVIRAVQRLAAEGYDQYLDVGCGLPVTGAVHEVVRTVLPAARVVYVDNESVAVAHGERLLATIDGTAMVNGDLRDPSSFLDAPATRDLLDLTRPVVVVLAAVIHFVRDDEHPAALLAELRDRLPAGSRIVLSHGTAGDTPATGAAVAQLYEESTNHAVQRDREQVATLLTGYTVDEGVTWVSDIYPDPTDPPTPDAGPRTHMYGAIATVPAQGAH